MSILSCLPLFLAMVVMAADGYGMGRYLQRCPSDANEKLEMCLATMNLINQFDFLRVDNCEEAIEAFNCVKMIIRSCWDEPILKGFGSMDIRGSYNKIKSVCPGISA